MRNDLWDCFHYQHVTIDRLHLVDTDRHLDGCYDVFDQESLDVRRITDEILSGVVGFLLAR